MRSWDAYGAVKRRLQKKMWMASGVDRRASGSEAFSRRFMFGCRRWDESWPGGELDDAGPSLWSRLSADRKGKACNSFQRRIQLKSVLSWISRLLFTSGFLLEDVSCWEARKWMPVVAPGTLRSFPKKLSTISIWTKYSSQRYSHEVQWWWISSLFLDLISSWPVAPASRKHHTLQNFTGIKTEYQAPSLNSPPRPSWGLRLSGLII